MDGREGAERAERVRVVSAVSDSERGGACIARELDVVRRVADHQRLVRGGANAFHQLLEHLGMRLGKALVGAARGREHAFEPLLRQSPVETGA